MTNILYSLISSGTGKCILIETNNNNVTPDQSKYVKSARKVLNKIQKGEVKRPNGLATLLHSSYAYNYIHGCEPEDNNPMLETFIFLCVTESSSYEATPLQARQTAYHYLLSIRNMFLEQFKNDLSLMIQNSKNNNNNINSDSTNFQNVFDDQLRTDFKRFCALMKDKMIQFANPHSGFEDDDDDSTYQNNLTNHTNNVNNNYWDEKKDEFGLTDMRRPPPPSGHTMYRPETGSKMTKIMGQLEQVKLTVLDGIENAMDRNEEISLLNNKANDLNESSSQFNRNSRNLRRRLCRELYQQKLVIALIAIFVLYLFSAMICGWTWNGCSN